MVMMFAENGLVKCRMKEIETERKKERKKEMNTKTTIHR